METFQLTQYAGTARIPLHYKDTASVSAGSSKDNKRKVSDIAQDKAGEDRDKSKEGKVSDIAQDKEGEPRKGIG